MELKGSKTEANLWKAFAGESQARNKYTYYASKARKEGFEQIAAIFEETAGNEKEHAKLWFKALGGINSTAENLVDAAEGEHYEWTDMYKEMAETAREEGFIALADLDAEDGRFHPDMSGVYHAGFARASIRALAEQAGFSQVEICTASVAQKPWGDYPIFLLTARR